MTQVNIKRVYDEPSEQDGYRVLVDRLWPRGMKREYLKYDYWAKEVTPSNDLRKWFHADVEKRWGAFADMYQKELKESFFALWALPFAWWFVFGAVIEFTFRTLKYFKPTKT